MHQHSRHIGVKHENRSAKRGGKGGETILTKKEENSQPGKGEMKQLQHDAIRMEKIKHNVGVIEAAEVTESLYGRHPRKEPGLPERIDTGLGMKLVKREG